MRKILILIAILYSVLLSLGYILGVIRTPAWMVYLGTTHHPQDYFYYLSQFTQGKTRFFTSLDLYSNDFPKPTLVGWTNVLAGRIGSSIGLSSVVTYQATLFFYTLGMFLLAVALLRAVFPNQPHVQLVALLLFGIQDVFPGGTKFFSNIAEPFVRFPRVPHQMLGLVCILLPMLIYLYLQNKQHKLNTKIIMYILLGIGSFVLASINPIQWMLTGLVLISASLWQYRSLLLRISNKELGMRNIAIGNSNQFASFIIPNSIFLILLVYFLCGIPMIVYLWQLFRAPPFSALSAWERTQYVKLTIPGFLSSAGPVALLAFLGLPLFFRRLTLPKFIIATYMVFSYVLFLSPAASMAGTTNIRFLCAITALCTSCVAAQLLSSFPYGHRIIRIGITYFAVVLLAIFFAPNILSEWNKSTNLDPGNAYVYVTKQIYESYLETAKQTSLRDVVLVTWPFDPSFPAITGRQGYMGHPLLTIDSEKKIQQAYYFYDAKVSDEEMHTFLLRNHITYVLSFTDVKKIIKPFLEVTYQNPTMTLYKVLP